MKLFNLVSKDIGIDLGTANILITLKGKGIVLKEPSVVAIDKRKQTVLATGFEAKEMLGRTPENIKAVKPMKDGVIADLSATQIMLKKMLQKVCNRYNAGRPRVVVGVPSGITEVEERAVEEAVLQAGAREVYLIEEPMAAAIGSNINVAEPTGNIIVDIGGGTTDIAILSLGNIVTSQSIKTAGNTFDQNIVDYIKEKYKLLIGEKTAESIKINIGTVKQGKAKEKMKVKGRDLIGGLPKTITITSEEIEISLKESINKIVSAMKLVLEQTPPELAADIIEKGIVLTGGGALLSGLAEFFQEELKVPVKKAKDPLSCVAEGTGIMLEKLC